MNSNPVSTKQRIEQAANWHVLIQADDLSETDTAAFNHWYSFSDNAQAYNRMDAMWSNIDTIDPALAHSTLRNVLADKKNSTQKSNRRTKIISSGALALIAVVFGLQSLPNEALLTAYLSPERLLSDYHTSVGENTVIVLSDNTKVHLNTFSAININYSDQQRSIQLIQGEIQIDVAKDANRPLVVMSEYGTAQALGTQFSVREQAQSTRISVTESRVEVCSNLAKNCQQLQAGETTQLRQDRVQIPKAINPRFIHNWSENLLIVENQPILKVLDELNRYQFSHFKIDRIALENMTISGVFPLDNINKSLQVLEGSLAINIKTYTALLTVIKAR